MKVLYLFRAKFTAIGFAALLFLGLPLLTNAAPVCGPGDHWVDDCSTDTDTFSSSATIGIDTNLDDIADTTVVLSGPTTVFRGDPVNDGTGHFNHIDTEIVSLNLTGAGFTIIAGDGVGNLTKDNDLHSPGAIDEQASDPAAADSFFDVFFEITTPVPGLGPLHNKDPLTLTSVITKVPPIGVTYTHNIPGPISLFDVNDVERARLVNASHTVVPIPAAVWLFGSALLALAGLSRRKKAA